MQIGEPQRIIEVEPLQLPVGQPDPIPEPDPVYTPEPEREPVPTHDVFQPFEDLTEPLTDEQMAEFRRQWPVFAK